MYNLRRDGIIAISVSLAITSSVCSGIEQVHHDAKLILYGPTKSIQGFPLLVRLGVYGEQKIPIVSVFDEQLELSLFFEDRAKGKVYRIYTGPDDGSAYTRRDGARISGPKRRILLPEGQCTSLLLDISSLAPLGPRAPTLSSVAPGDYKVYVEIPFTGLRSNSIDIAIDLPNPSEAKFLAEFFEKRRGRGRRSWCNALIENENPSDLNWSQLPEVSADLISFHRLLLHAYSDDRSDLVKYKTFLRGLRVPKYLEPFKELLLIEVQKQFGLDAQSVDSEQRMLAENKDCSALIVSAKNGKMMFLSAMIKKEAPKASGESSTDKKDEAEKKQDDEGR